MKKMYLAISSVMIAVAALVVVNVTGTKTMAASGARDCNNNSIIYCGALTQSELLSKYDKDATGDLHAIYAHYGISRSDLAGTTSQVVMGKAFRDGHVEVNGKTVATNAYSLGRNNIGSNHPININGRTYYERNNTSAFLSDIDAFVLMRNGQFYRAVLTSCSNPLMATPTPPPVQPKAVYTCNSLKATKVTRTDYSFTTDASASNGAMITGYTYDFGDGKSASSTNANVTHTYDQAGTYTVKVTVKVDVNGTAKTVTSDNCQTTVTVEEQVLPVYRCDALTSRVISLADRTYEYALSYTADNGATLGSVDYDFGDGTTVTRTGADQTLQHTYTKAGSYRTVATLHFNVTENDKTTVKDVNCEVAVSTSPEMCTVPGKENLPKNSPQCKETVAVQELPHTGLADFLGGGLGIGSLTAAGYYWRGSRRNLADKIRNR